MKLRLPDTQTVTVNSFLLLPFFIFVRHNVIYICLLLKVMSSSSSFDLIFFYNFIFPVFREHQLKNLKIPPP